MRLLINAVPESVDLKNAIKNAMDSKSLVAPLWAVNIGNSQPAMLLDFINAIEEATGMAALINLLPTQAGDVPATWADTSSLEEITGYNPATDFFLRDHVRCKV